MTLLKVEIDKRVADGAGKDVVEKVLRAGRSSVEDATRRLEKDLEDLTRRSVRGRAWRAWKSKVFPRDGELAYEPVGNVFVNGDRRSQGMMSYWTQPGINRARSGRWLAIPTEAAGSRGKARDLTPEEWQQRTGIKLSFVATGRGTAVLMAQGILAANGSGVLRQATAARRARDAIAGRGRKVQSVPVFVLVPAQRHADRVGIESAVARAERRLIEDFGTRIQRI